MDEYRNTRGISGAIYRAAARFAPIILEIRPFKQSLQVQTVNWFAFPGFQVGSRVNNKQIHTLLIIRNI